MTLTLELLVNGESFSRTVPSGAITASAVEKTIV
jgi:hypothetical protein